MRSQTLPGLDTRRLFPEIKHVTRRGTAPDNDTTIEESPSIRLGPLQSPEEKDSKINNEPKWNNEPECFRICPKIIPRSEWKSRRPKRVRRHTTSRVSPVLFKSTAADTCQTKEECLKQVKFMQNYHMEIYELPDIAHSFLIGEDGNVYEGRGWGLENDQGPGFAGIGYMGHYTNDSYTQPTRAMKRAAFRLILCGIQKGFLKNPFKKGIKTDYKGLPDEEMWNKYLLQQDFEY